MVTKSTDIIQNAAEKNRPHFKCQKIRHIVRKVKSKYIL